MIKMNNRVIPKGYELIWEKQENTLYEDCRIAVESIAILKRTKVNGYYVRCVFRSLTENPVSAVRVDIALEDDTGNVVFRIDDYQYDGFDTVRGSIFGQTIAIPVKTEAKEKISYAEIFAKSVYFENGQYLECEGRGMILPAEQTLSDYFSEKDLTEYYIREAENGGNLVPVSSGAFWRCSCGAVNDANEEICFECGVQKRLLFENLDSETLAEKAEEYRRQKEEEERLRFEEEEKERAARKKRNKKIAIAATLIVAVTILGLLADTYLLPEIKYSAACDAMEAGEYSTAMESFEKLKERQYKDSEALLVDCTYQYGLQQKEAGEYDSALAIFVDLANYEDSKEQVQDVKYLMGQKMIEDGQYKEAIVLFKQLGKYKKSYSKRMEAMYGYICANTDSKYSDEFISYVKKLRKNKYKDIEDIYKELYKWKATIVVNNSEKDTETAKSKISKYDKIYCHVKLSGGEPKGTTRLKYSATYPNGSTVTGQWDKTWKADTEGMTSFWYDIPEYGAAGTFQIKIYNAADGKLLGKKSVELTN